MSRNPLSRAAAPWRAAILAAALAGAVVPARALVITNVTVVNATPFEFGVFFRASEPVTPSIEVYADAAGLSNLAGLVGVEWTPVLSADPQAANEYARRRSAAGLSGQSATFGLCLARVSGLASNTAYYFRVGATPSGGGGSVVWPAAGLATARTAATSVLLPEAKALLVTVPPGSVVGAVTGRIGILQAPGALSALSALVGDGAASNQLYFPLASLYDAATGLGYSPTGSVTLSIVLYGPLAEPQMARTYGLIFDGETVVADPVGLLMDAQYFVLRMGRTNVAAGTADASVPISMVSGGQSTGVVFNLAVTGSGLTNLSVSSPIFPQASLAPLGGNVYRITLGAPAAQAFSSPSLQEMETASLNFGAASNISAAIFPLDVSTLRATAVGGGLVTNGLLYSGQVAVLADGKPVNRWMQSVPSGGMRITGYPGVTYLVESSSNLMESGWTLLQEVTLGPTNMDLLIPLGSWTNRSYLFFRSRQKN